MSVDKINRKILHKKAKILADTMLEGNEPDLCSPVLAKFIEECDQGFTVSEIFKKVFPKSRISKKRKEEIISILYNKDKIHRINYKGELIYFLNEAYKELKII